MLCIQPKKHVFQNGCFSCIRIRRLSLGKQGDVKPVGEGVSELRIDYGPGYRIYFIQRGRTLVVLPAGGNKRTQNLDIQIVIELARNL